MMDSDSPKPEIVRFSSENWKILESLREEKRKLEEFNASVVTSNSDEASIPEETEDQLKIISEHDETDDQDLVSPIKLQKKHEIKIEKYCRPSLCNLKTYFEKDLNGKEILNAIEENDIESENSVKIDKKIQDGEDEKTICSNWKQSDLFADVPRPLRSFILCLMSISSFRQFVKGISKELPDIHEKQEEYPTIGLFIDYFWKMSTFSLKYDNCHSETSFPNESLSSMLVTVFVILHEELVHAKQKKLLKNICMDGCRLVQKGNHSIVSHLFRGHFKRKVYCECDHVESSKEFFTIINIHPDDFQTKLLIVKVVHHVEKSLITTRFSVNVNNHSTVTSLIDKLLSTGESNGLQNLNRNSLLVSIVKLNEIKKIIPSDVSIFDVMCEDGEIWLFDVHVGNVMLQKHIETSCEIIPDCDADSSNIPRSSLASGTIEIESIASNCKKSNHALVSVTFTWINEIEESGFSCLLEVPRISNGLYVYDRLARVLGLNNSDLQKVVICLKNKMKHCLICLNSCCQGCTLQMSDKVTLSNNYIIHVKLALSTRNEMIKCVDDDSILLNEPINILTIDECISQHLRSLENPICKACSKSAVKQIKIGILKKPNILCIHVDKTRDSKNIPSIKADLSIEQMQGKSLKLRCYSLHSLILRGEGSLPCLRKDILLNFPYPDAFQIFDPDSMKLISTLFYIRDEGCSYEKNRRFLKKINNRDKEHSQCNNKYSPRSGQVIDIFGKKLCSPRQEFDCVSYGLYTPRSFSSLSQKTVCVCQRCQTLGNFHAKIVEGKSSLSHMTRPQMCSSENRVLSPDSVQSVFGKENALHKTIRNQDLKGLVKCLEAGADVNQLVRGMAALHLTASMAEPFGSIFTKLCLKYGGDANLPSSNDGMTPIHTAVMMNNPDILIALLQAGGIPHTKDLHGRSAFDILLQSGNKNSEYMLRLLRSETHEKLSSNQAEDLIEKRFSALNISGENILDHGITDIQDKIVKDLVHISVIGETTFDKVFTEENNETNERLSCHNIEIADDQTDLDESAVSQHFTEIDDSGPSFHGSTLPFWLSWFSCTQHRQRRMTLRERAMRIWYNIRNIFQ